MKNALKAIIICTVALLVIWQSAVGHAYNPKFVKLKGTWFIRGQDTCKELKFSRKGRAEPELLDYKAYIDKRSDALYLTMKKYDWIQTYRMNPLDESEKNFILELVVVGPNQPPTGATPLKDRYTGMFRSMVNCQIGPTYREPTEGRSSW